MEFIQTLNVSGSHKCTISFGRAVALAKSIKTLLVLRALVSAIVRSSKLKVHEGEFFAVYFNTITAETSFITGRGCKC